MTEADRITIASGISGPDLMEKAGLTVADAISLRWKAQPVTVLCGPGNNGGDGFVIARLLAQRGWPVRLALLGQVNALTGDAAHHAAAWTGPVEPLSPECVREASLVVDAVFGAGLSRPIEGVIADTLRQITAPIIAVDMLSGVDGNTGQVRGFAAKASLTVTFFSAKPGHWLYPGRDLCGELLVTDIGISHNVLSTIQPRITRNAPSGWDLPQSDAEDHKYRRGHCLIATGVMPGASRLAAHAALRAGAGLVSVAVAPARIAEVAAMPAAVIQRPCPDLPSFARLAQEPRVSSLIIGPGAGADGRTRRRVLAALATGKAITLDADALTAFAEEPARLLKHLPPSPAVLTPHEGEFSRLFPDITGDKLSRARQAAARAGAVVLLKGPDTIIAAPDGRAAINTNAPPWLATAGSGDVLAGIIGGLLAQGLPPFEAACAGAWLHGEAANAHTSGMIADDLPAALPQALLSARDYVRVRQS
jgi:NAD(P)H-hydrate epimerase